MAAVVHRNHFIYLFLNFILKIEFTILFNELSTIFLQNFIQFWPKTKKFKFKNKISMTTKPAVSYRLKIENKLKYFKLLESQLIL